VIGTRRGRAGWVLLAALCAVAGPLRAPGAYGEELAPYTMTNLFRSLLPTVVNIIARGQMEDPAPGMMAATEAPPAGRIKTVVGSGFVTDPSGIIVTNWHVVAGASEIVVNFSDGSSNPATLLSATRVGDIALLKVEAGHPLAVARWGDSDKVEVGDPVVAIGNPLGLGMSVSSGIVSALNRNIMETPVDNFIQTDAAINHGNSGGPLFNMRGEVIGIDTAIVSPTTGSSGLGFAIPASTAQFIIGRMLKYGWLRPSWLGLTVQQVTPDMARALGMARPEGSIVAATSPGGPAEKAGLQIGDVVLRFGDKTPSDERALLRMIAEAPEGQASSLTVWRAGQEQVLPVVVREWPRQQWDKYDMVSKAAPIRWTLPPDFGLTLADLSDKNRAHYGLDTQQTGVLVTGVAADTDAAEHGLVPGDVILRVQDTPVGSSSELQAKLDAARDAKRSFVLLLVLPKVQTRPGATWIPLRVGPD
jgi:serine protease Do